ncbi:MAG TPA: GNAT family N-acetyltransferase [Oscillospiraceae bacterium]|nr:GNAT family N-acetyltransferase [Oscillospiraceae bacterium]HPF55519.1 GNAT family N-acetyltransferase [Clostridiales bacterium]HPK35707.1 GNAT family N-acetyltransferase [Oscillospiraceae bacterium]HPR76570.1 GNAT family N-acetyltransferase [Oscillospiraceae bacterium]
MTDLEFCIAYAENDLPHRALLLYCLKSGAAQILYCGEDGILIHEENAGHYLLSAKDHRSAGKLIKRVPETDTILAHEEFYDDILRAKNPSGITRCNTAAYLKKEPPEAVDDDIRQLTVVDLPMMIEYYHLYTDEEYFTERLAGGFMYGIYIDGSPAGFIGRHDSGEMGFLEVFEPYRKKGLGLKLEKFLIRKVLAEGNLPVGEVILGNTASMALQRKAGMQIDTSQTVTWWNFET